MKDCKQKKSFVVQMPRKATPTSPRNNEITITKHCCPNPMRENMGNFPQVRCNELPNTSLCQVTNPVYKYADRFLADSASNYKKKLTGNVSRACVNNIKKKVLEGKYCSNNETCSKSFSTKKSQIPSKSFDRSTLNRIRANLGNIRSNNDLRVSLKNNHFPSCHGAKDSSSPTNPVLKPESLKTSIQDDCLEKLKEEIKKFKQSSFEDKQNSDEYEKFKIPAVTADSVNCNLPSSCLEKLREQIKTSNKNIHEKNIAENDKYVKKLKEELACRNDKCLQEARNIINELQNEIMSYRLQAKTKYSSSCSDICEKATSGAKEAKKDSDIHAKKDSDILQRKKFDSNHGDGTEFIVLQCLTDHPDIKCQGIKDLGISYAVKLTGTALF